jgi:hypothetical protein
VALNRVGNGAMVASLRAAADSPGTPGTTTIASAVTPAATAVRALRNMALRRWWAVSVIARSSCKSLVPFGEVG